MGLLQRVREKVAELFGPKKRIRLTRSIILNAQRDAEEGEVLELPLELAEQLIRDDSAVPCEGTKQP
jgi:hypothetical protein